MTSTARWRNSLIAADEGETGRAVGEISALVSSQRQGSYLPCQEIDISERMSEVKMKYVGRFKRREVFGLRAWLIHIWSDYEHWHLGIKPDGIRILGFEWNRYYE